MADESPGPERDNQEQRSLIVEDEKRTLSGLRYQYVHYSPDIAESIADYFTQGRSLSAIAKIDGMPSYGAIMRWYQTNKDFRKLIDDSRATRALFHEEEAIGAVDTALDSDDKDRVALARLRFDTHTWAAGINDATRFGKKTTIEGNADKPITFVIKTGIPDPLPHQVQPELGADGMVKKKDIETIGREVVVEEGTTPEGAELVHTDVGTNEFNSGF